MTWETIGPTRIAATAGQRGAFADKAFHGLTLLFAVREGRLEVVRVLIEAGADVKEAMRPERRPQRAARNGTAPWRDAMTIQGPKSSAASEVRCQLRTSASPTVGRFDPAGCMTKMRPATSMPASVRRAASRTDNRLNPASPLTRRT